MFSSLYSYELLYLHFSYDVINTVFFKAFDMKQIVSPEDSINFCLVYRRQRLGRAL